VKYDLVNCSRKCNCNPGNLPSGVGELLHRWFEEGANREALIARGKEVGVKLTGGSLQRHKANHLIPARGPGSPAGDDGDTGRRYSELEVVDSVIQRFARQMQAGSQQVTTEQGLRAIELKHRLTEGSVFEALFDALSGDDADDDMSDLEPSPALPEEVVLPLEPPITGV